MSLFGALNSGVSALKSQGSAIGIISDNISNLNTTGYKRSEASFATLVNNTAGSVTYNPGGVINNQQQKVDRQGLLQATDSPTDIAISGAGFMVVNTLTDSSGETLYTRAGSFQTDDLGNFQNANGFYLQGWRLDSEGRLPGEPGNLNTTSSAEIASLETVNLRSSSGTATATTSVELGANLDASQVVFPGAGRDVDFESTENDGIAQSDVIVPVAGNLADGDTITVTTDGGLIYTFEYGGVEASNDVTGGIFAATAVSQTMFLSGAEPTGTDATFTITTATLGTLTFTYTQSSPNPFLRQFNSLSTLTSAIDEINGLSARIDNNIMYIAPDESNDAMTFANGGATDWLTNVGLTDTIAAAANPRFASLRDLAAKVNDSDGISATISNPLADTTVEIRTDNPLGTITFDDSYGAGAYNLLIEMDIIDLATDTRTFGPVYDVDNAVTDAGNMASEEITPHFRRNMQIFDSLGTGHNISIGFLKIDTNTWAVEVYAADDNDINSDLADDQIARGNLTFNGDGSLAGVGTGLALPATIEWRNGAAASEVTFIWGTAGDPVGTVGATEIGLTDGMSQFDSDYNVSFVFQNGAEVGSMVGVTIDEDGFVIGNFSNGESQRIYKLPVAQFANVNGLAPLTGNAYFASEEAGVVNLREAGTNGQGTIVSGALESSNVELAEELTDMIVSQRAYQASTRVISTTDELLEELNRL